MIEEKIPLKQGLKRQSSEEPRTQICIEEKIPLKQGLKLITFHAASAPLQIEEKIPLKQGLKHNMKTNIKVFANH